MCLAHYCSLLKIIHSTHYPKVKKESFNGFARCEPVNGVMRFSESSNAASPTKYVPAGISLKIL